MQHHSGNNIKSAWNARRSWTGIRPRSPVGCRYLRRNSLDIGVPSVNESYSCRSRTRTLYRGWKLGRTGYLHKEYHHSVTHMFKRMKHLLSLWILAIVLALVSTNVSFAWARNLGSCASVPGPGYCSCYWYTDDYGRKVPNSDVCDRNTDGVSGCVNSGDCNNGYSL